MIIEETIVKTAKLDASERNALEILSTVNCNGIECFRCPFCADLEDSCVVQLSREVLGYDRH